MDLVNKSNLELVNILLNEHDTPTEFTNAILHEFITRHMQFISKGISMGYVQYSIDPEDEDILKVVNLAIKNIFEKTTLQFLKQTIEESEERNVDYKSDALPIHFQTIGLNLTLDYLGKTEMHFQKNKA